MHLYVRVPAVKMHSYSGYVVPSSDTTVGYKICAAEHLKVLKHCIELHSIEFQQALGRWIKRIKQIIRDSAVFTRGTTIIRRAKQKQKTAKQSEATENLKKTVPQEKLYLVTKPNPRLPSTKLFPQIDNNIKMFRFASAAAAGKFYSLSAPSTILRAEKCTLLGYLYSHPLYLNPNTIDVYTVYCCIF